MPYGYRLNGLEPEIVPEEAEVVRQIYSSALHGRGRKSIAKELNELGIERGHGRKVWHHTTVHYILTNSFYTGDSVWHKFCTTDTLPFQTVQNRGQQPKYHVENDHPAIISREDFQRVQELIGKRREQFHDGAVPSRSPYIGKIYCGRCGSKFRRKECRDKIYWDCYRHNAGKDLCPSHQISEETLTAAVLRLHNKLMLHGQELLQSLLDQLREIRELELRSNQRLSNIDKEIVNISGQNLVLIRLKSNPDCGQAVRISDEALAGQVDERLRKLAQAPHLLTAPEPQQAEVDMNALRLHNELTLALNRGADSPQYIKSLAFAAAAQRYSQLPDPTPAHELEQLRARLEQGPADADTLADLLTTAVRAVRLTSDKNVELELVNGKIIAEKEAQSA